MGSFPLKKLKKVLSFVLVELAEADTDGTQTFSFSGKLVSPILESLLADSLQLPTSSGFSATES